MSTPAIWTTCLRSRSFCHSSLGLTHSSSLNLDWKSSSQLSHLPSLTPKDHEMIKFSVTLINLFFNRLLKSSFNVIKKTPEKVTVIAWISLYRMTYIHLPQLSPFFHQSDLAVRTDGPSSAHCYQPTPAFIGICSGHVQSRGSWQCAHHHSAIQNLLKPPLSFLYCLQSCHIYQLLFWLPWPNT